MGIIMGAAYSLLYDWEKGLFGGLFSGIGFGLAMAGVNVYLKNKFQKDPLIFPDGETLIKEGAANLKNKMEGAGGWLYLTDQKLVFRPHSFNFNNQPTEIPLDEISEALPSHSLGIVPNGLKIVLRDQTVKKFVVENRKDWCAQINRLIGRN